MSFHSPQPAHWNPALNKTPVSCNRLLTYHSSDFNLLLTASDYSFPTSQEASMLGRVLSRMTAALLFSAFLLGAAAAQTKHPTRIANQRGRAARARCGELCQNHPESALAELARHGITYSNARTPANSDSFPACWPSSLVARQSLTDCSTTSAMTGPFMIPPTRPARAKPAT